MKILGLKGKDYSLVNDEIVREVSWSNKGEYLAAWCPFDNNRGSNKMKVFSLIDDKEYSL